MTGPVRSRVGDPITRSATKEELLARIARLEAIIEVAQALSVQYDAPPMTIHTVLSAAWTDVESAIDARRHRG